MPIGGAPPDVRAVLRRSNDHQFVVAPCDRFYQLVYRRILCKRDIYA